MQYRQGDLVGALVSPKGNAKRDDPEVAAHLAEVLWAIGRTQDARRTLREVSRNTRPTNCWRTPSRSSPLDPMRFDSGFVRAWRNAGLLSPSCSLQDAPRFPPRRSLFLRAMRWRPFPSKAAFPCHEDKNYSGRLSWRHDRETTPCCSLRHLDKAWRKLPGHLWRAPDDQRRQVVMKRPDTETLTYWTSATCCR